MLKEIKNTLLLQQNSGIKTLYLEDPTKLNSLKTKNPLPNHAETSKVSNLPLKVTSVNISTADVATTNIATANINTTIAQAGITTNTASFNYTLLEQAQSLQDIKNILESFDDCLLKQTAINTVFGDGNFNKKILIIGEAPGNEEDEQGVPFVGRGGVLLSKAFSYIGIQRDDCFITNRVFWRPPGNRTPSELEIQQCYPFIKQIINVLKPKLIILVGKTATINFLPQDAITKLIGKNFEVNIDNNIYNVKAVYHPAYLLRSSSKKIALWHDMIEIEEFLKQINI